jgi:pimeloyl-ACP methyl ester carboxylesterase
MLHGMAVTRRTFTFSLIGVAPLAVAACAGIPSGEEARPVPVVLLHSLAGSPRQWAQQTTALSGSRQVYASYWGGHAETPLPQGEPSIEALAGQLIDDLQSAGINRAIFVGHSAGAAIAIASAKLAPKLVAGLFLVDPPGDLHSLPPAATAGFLAGVRSSTYAQIISEYWRSILQGARPTTSQVVLADLRDTQQATVVYVLTALTRFDPIPIIASFAGPMVSVTSPPNSEPNSLHRLYPRLEHHSFSNVSHWIHLDDANALNPLLLRFVASVDAG